MPRPKGSLNRATREIREASRLLLADPDHQASLRRRLIAGEAPHMETLLHHYAWGKPREEIEVSADVIIRNVATMSTEDLMAELEAHQQATALFLTQQTPVRDVLAAPS